MPVRVGDCTMRDPENIEFDVRFAPSAGEAVEPKLWAGTVTLDRHVSWLMPYERRAYSFVVVPPEASLE